MAEKYTPEYWSSEIRRARDEREKKFYQQAEESIKLYNCAHDLDDVVRKLNCWWYCASTLLPAYYSRAPKVEASLRKRAGSAIYNLASVSIERAVQYVLEEEMDFDDLGYQAAVQFELVGLGVLWVRYDASVIQKPYEYALNRLEDGSYEGADDKPFTGDPKAVYERDGLFLYEDLRSEKVNETVKVESLHFRDYLESIARNEQEIEWKARRAYLSREEAAELFGKDTANSLSYDTLPEDIKKEYKDDISKYEGKAELEEIWCRESGKVYWLHRRGDKNIIEAGDPPIEYKDFWPCTTIKASIDPNSVIPVSDYTHARDQILEVERMTTRIAGTIQAIRANAAYDASLGNELEGILSGDLKMIPIKNWPAYKSRGGLQQGVEFLPIDNYISALQTLVNQRQIALQGLYETLRVSDLMRGVSDPEKTATANKLEHNWGSLSLSVRQRRFEKFISDAIGKVGEVICDQYASEKIYEIADAEDLLQSSPGTTWEQVYAAIKDEPKRRYRIQIASDSLQALDERAERQERTDMISSAGSFLQQVVPFVEKYPVTAPMCMEMLQYVIRSYKAGKELEETLTSTLQGVIQTAQSQQGQMNQSPQPGVMEAQTKLQIAQLQMQMDQEKLQAEMQKNQMDFELKRQQMLLDLEKLNVEKDRLSVEIAKIKGDQDISILQFHQEEKKIQAQLTKELLDTKQEQIKQNGVFPNV